MLRFALLVALAGGPLAVCSRGAAPPPKTVYLAGALSDEQTLVFTSSVASGDPRAVVLFDSPLTTPYLKAFLTAFNPKEIVPVGSFRDGWDDLRPFWASRDAALRRGLGAGHAA